MLVRVQVSLFLTLTNDVLVHPRQALASQTNTRIDLFRLIPRRPYLFDLAAGSSSTREEIQVENSPRSGKEVESACIRTVQTRKYPVISPRQLN